VQCRVNATAVIITSTMPRRNACPEHHCRHSYVEPIRHVQWHAGDETLIIGWMPISKPAQAAANVKPSHAPTAEPMILRRSVMLRLSGDELVGIETDEGYYHGHVEAVRAKSRDPSVTKKQAL